MVKRTPRVGASRFRKRKPCSFETASAYEAAIHDSIRHKTHTHFLLLQFSNARQKVQVLQKPTVNPSESPPRTLRAAHLVAPRSLASRERRQDESRVRRVRAPVHHHQGTSTSGPGAPHRSSRTSTPRRDLASVPTASRSPASPRFRSPLRPLSSRQQEQGNKSRIRGIEAQKANIQAAKSVARTLRSSLGPKVRRAGDRSRDTAGARETPQRTPIPNASGKKKKPRPASVFSANATIARRELTPPSL